MERDRRWLRGSGRMELQSRVLLNIGQGPGRMNDMRAKKSKAESMLKKMRNAARAIILAEQRHKQSLKLAEQRHKQILARFRSVQAALSHLPLDIVNTVEARDRILSLAKLLLPYAAIGHNKVRVGREGDGGYVMIGDFEDIGGALSFGIGDEMSWDLDVAARGITVHQFDHSIDAPPATHPKIHFHRTKVVDLPSSEGETLESIFSDTAVDPEREWLLKVDIEDDEWAVFDAASETSLRKMRQIVCELHYFGLIATDQQRYERCLSVLRKLVRLFGVVHVHANNYAPMMMIGGVPFPSIIEVTFAARKHYDFVVSNEIFPTPLDSPNKQNSPDYFLGRFIFD